MILLPSGPVISRKFYKMPACSAPNGHRLLAHTTGRMRMNFVRLAVGDRVTVKCSPYDLSKGCIAFEDE